MYDAPPVRVSAISTGSTPGTAIASALGTHDPGVSVFAFRGRRARPESLSAFLERHPTAERPLAEVIQEVYVHGVSTRSVDTLVQSKDMTGISGIQVSRLAGRD